MKILEDRSKYFSSLSKRVYRPVKGIPIYLCFNIQEFHYKTIKIFVLIVDHI